MPAASPVGLSSMNYSYLKASIGSSLDAFAAGRMPNSTPTAPENPSASSAAQSGTLAVYCSKTSIALNYLKTTNLSPAKKN